MAAITYSGLYGAEQAIKIKGTKEKINENRTGFFMRDMIIYLPGKRFPDGYYEALRSWCLLMGMVNLV